MSAAHQLSVLSLRVSGSASVRVSVRASVTLMTTYAGVRVRGLVIIRGCFDTGDVERDAP